MQRFFPAVEMCWAVNLRKTSTFCCLPSRGVSWFWDVPEHCIISRSLSLSTVTLSLQCFQFGLRIFTGQCLVTNSVHTPCAYKRNLSDLSLIILTFTLQLAQCGFVLRCRMSSETCSIILSERAGAVQFICKESELCSFNLLLKEWSVFITCVCMCWASKPGQCPSDPLCCSVLSIHYPVLKVLK